MNKGELIDAIAAGAGITKKAAGDALEAMISAVTKTLQAGGTVQITGFGSYKVSYRKARMGRNPKTGETISIPASKAPKFTAGKSFKDAIR